LLDLLSVYTPSGEEFKARRVFEDLSSWLGIKLKVTPTGSFYLGEGSQLLLASHIDTVPGEIEVREENGTIYGRGAVDAKGPLAAMIVAAWMAKLEGRKITVSALADEELSSRGARELASSGRRFKFAVIGEPTSTSNIAVEYRGSLHLDVTCRGESSHSSSAQSNLIVELCKRVLEVYRGPAGYDEVSIVPTIFRAGDALNVTPAEAYLHLDVRYSHKVSFEGFFPKLKEAFSQCDVRVVDHTPPVKADVNGELVKALMRAMVRQGIRPKLVRKRGTSDMNILSSITDEVVAYGPGDSTLEHTYKEKISLEELYIGAMVYKRLIDEICGNLDCSH